MASPVTLLVTPGHRPARLDYLRGCIKYIPSGEESCSPENITDYLEPFFENAIEKGATAYIFGEFRRGLKKINQIHMNQDGRSIGPNLGSQAEYCEENPVTGTGARVRRVTDTKYPPVGITALLYPDYSYEAFYPHGEPVCHLTICNITKDAVVDLTGWEISLSRSAEVHAIQDVQFSPVGGRSSLRVSPKWFPGRGGTIYLRNRENIVVDKVSYYQELVQKSGKLLYFGQTHEWTVC
ncbi:hypothetical protein IWW34DRAFT_896122 [Fusarium oxysporum f. sp. albedinis]|nr:hypothetical protein IWW34DRAFT_896122 [Fusarium oxysporum f. sp. albedinis]